MLKKKFKASTANNLLFIFILQVCSLIKYCGIFPHEKMLFEKLAIDKIYIIDC